MKISACYIVRNEAENLAQSLASVTAAADEIIVVDTGSTDATKSIAHSYGAAVYDYAWDDDFAAPRNLAIEHAGGDYIVFLDADEYFSAATSGQVRRIIERYAGVDVLLVPWHNIDRTTGEVLLDSYAPRIFARKENLRYEGRIHEELRDNGEPIASARRLARDELEIVHTGYSAALSREKAARNLRLLEREAAASAHPEDYYMYIAEAQRGLGNTGEAIRCAELDVARGRRSIVFASRSYRLLLGLLAATDDSAYHLSVARRAAADFPEIPEFHAELAECLAGTLDFDAACREAQTAITSYHEFSQLETLEPSFFTAAMLAQLQERLALWQEIIAAGERLKLASVLIFRDNIADIERYSESAAVYSDEIVAVDTGSTDGTREQLARLGARVKIIDYPWQDDFAAAKNVGLAAATGDWLLLLDADEYFVEPAAVRSLLAMVTVTDPSIDALMLPLVNIDIDNGGREIERTHVLRAVRAGRGICYAGRVHEQLVGRAPLNTYVERDRAVINHTGYSASRMLAKAKKYLALMESEPDSDELAKNYGYIAESYLTLGRSALALAYAQKALATPWRGLGSHGRSYYVIWQAQRALNAPFRELIATARAGQQAVPELPDFHAIEGLVLAYSGGYAQAAAKIEQALALEHTTSLETSCFSVLRAETLELYSLALASTGRRLEARELAGALLREDPYRPTALEVYIDTTEDIEPAAVLELFASPEEGRSYLRHFALARGRVDIMTMLDENNYLTELMLGTNAELFSRLKARLSIDIAALFTVIWAVERSEQPSERALLPVCEELLPAGTHRAWRAYRGEELDYSEAEWAPLLDYALKYGTDEQALNYILLGAKLGWGKVMTIVPRILAHNRDELAFAVLSQVPADSEAVDGDFWYYTGIALFRLGEQAGAAECLERADSLGTEQRTAPFRQWIAEAAR